MRAVYLILALSLWGCVSGPKFPGPVALSGFDGFPTNFAEGDLLAVARFKIDHASNSECRVDLIAAKQVIPIWVTTGLAKNGDSSHATLITREHMDMRLYLPDGTALMPIADLDGMVNSLSSTPKQYVSGRLFEGEVLQAFSTERDAPNNGYVFFQIPAGRAITVRGRTVSHTVGDATRSFDLNEALVSFNITVDGKPHPVMVGVQ